MLKKIIALTLTLCMLASLALHVFPAGESELPFGDVKTKDWFYNSVKYAYENDLMAGTKADTFAPNGTVTRSQFVAILGRIHGAEQTLTTKFPDVPSNKLNWYNGYVGWASDAGIVAGYSNGNFGPNDPVTREQMAAFIDRYLTYIGILPKLSVTAPASFPDIAKVSSYAVKSVENLRTIGIIQGDSAGRFAPKNQLNRASVATVVMNLHKMLVELQLGDPITPDYTVEGKDFALMGAYDLYYGGTALDTGYSGLGIKKTTDGYPFITYDENDTQYFFASGSRTKENGTAFNKEPDRSPLAKSDFYYEVDMRIACIDPAEYPFVRIGYRTSGNAGFGVYSENLKVTTSDATPVADKVDSFSYAILDVTGAWNSSSEQITPTVTSDADIDLLYFAAFPTREAAEAFDITAYKANIESYSGSITNTVAASEGDVAKVIAEANAKAQAIIDSSDDIDPKSITGTCYYISNDGDDSNPGTSPDKPWATFKNLTQELLGGLFIVSTVKAGDAVFLERGSVFNVNEGEMNYIDIQNGVAYSAYGEGPKPVITAELPMKESAGKWSATEWENVWKLDYEIFDMPGNISFVKKDGVTLWGIMTVFNSPKTPFNGQKSIKYGYVSNGEETFISGGVVFNDPGALQNNLEYVADPVSGELYLYCKDGNPGSVFSEIHISTSNGMVGYNQKSPKSTTPARFDNISLKYTGSCAIGTGEVKNLCITNCTFEWIGGAYQGGDDSVRYGNAIQNWGSCDGIIVRDCYFRDVYDAAATTQGGSGIMRNFYASGCVLDRCALSFEFFNHNDTSYYPENELVNIFITDNYVINNGYGFCDVRTDRRSAFLYTSYGNSGAKHENIVYENNVNVYSAEYAIYSCEIALGQSEGTILKNNKYYMDPTEAIFIRSTYNLIDSTGDSGACIPYTSRYLTYLNSIGVEVGSTFYTTVNPDINCAN